MLLVRSRAPNPPLRSQLRPALPFEEDPGHRPQAGIRHPIERPGRDAARPINLHGLAPIRIIGAQRGEQTRHNTGAVDSWTKVVLARPV